MTQKRVEPMKNESAVKFCQRVLRAHRKEGKRLEYILSVAKRIEAKHNGKV